MAMRLKGYPPMTPFELASTITNFKKEVKISYYISVAHNLTVAIRGIWSDETIAVADRLDRIKWMNEAMHRILNRLNEFQMICTTFSGCLDWLATFLPSDEEVHRRAYEAKDMLLQG